MEYSHLKYIASCSRNEPLSKCVFKWAYLLRRTWLNDRYTPAVISLHWADSLSRAKGNLTPDQQCTWVFLPTFRRKCGYCFTIGVRSWGREWTFSTFWSTLNMKIAFSEFHIYIYVQILWLELVSQFSTVWAKMWI